MEILAVQGGFYRSLQAAVLALKADGAALWSLSRIGFTYGVFHAAGPGHGKAVIAAYLMSSERALLKGFAIRVWAGRLWMPRLKRPLPNCALFLRVKPDQHAGGSPYLTQVLCASLRLNTGGIPPHGPTPALNRA